jgi:hypothetical protein
LFLLAISGHYCVTKEIAFHVVSTSLYYEQCFLFVYCYQQYIPSTPRIAALQISVFIHIVWDIVELKLRNMLRFGSPTQCNKNIMQKGMQYVWKKE